MKKDWFVIQNNKHIGPYSWEELEQKYKNKDISDSTQIWKEGLDDSKDYESVNEELESIPEIPVDLEEVQEDKVEVKDIFSEQIELSPDLKDAELSNELSNELTKKELPVNPSTKKSDGARARLLKILVSLSFLLCFMAIILFISINIILPKFDTIARPAKMSLSTFKEIKSLSTSKGMENKFKIFLSKDRSMLWGGTNIPYTGDLVLKINSLPRKHLGEEEIEAISFGKLNNYIARFENITFNYGDRIHEGYYKIEVYTTKELSVPFIKKVTKPKMNREFRYLDTFYLGHLEPDEFEKILEKKQEAQRRNENKFWEELRQKYLTVKMISVQIQNAIKRVFKKKNLEWKDKVKAFEDDYKAKYGEFFTSFVIANEKSYKKLKKQEFKDKLDIISHYTKLSRIAKNIGTQTMDVLHTLDSSSQETLEIKEQSMSRLVGIIDICEQKISMIDSKIKAKFNHGND